jgi:hypothetical protein
MRTIVGIITLTLLFPLSFSTTFASQSPPPQLNNFISDTLAVAISLATVFASLFLVKGGYEYITSSANPDALENAKNTIRKSLIGLVLVISSAIIANIFTSSLTSSSTPTPSNSIQLSEMESPDQPSGLSQVLLDAIAQLLKSIVISATAPITTGLVSFLTTTPSVLENSVVFDFWLKMTVIASSLYILLIALLGFNFMSASQFGFEHQDLKHLLPRIGLAFLGTNFSIFLIDWLISLSNVIVSSILATTGGFQQAWITNAFDPLALQTGATNIITLIFMLLFVILSSVLLLFYLTRLIIISLGAAISPFVFLIWLIPKFSDFAQIAGKSYLIQIFVIIVHVITIQLAASFLTIPTQTQTNPLISILIGIALLFTLIKTPQAMLQFAMYTSFGLIVRQFSTKAINVMQSSTRTQPSSQPISTSKLTQRKVVNG